MYRFVLWGYGKRGKRFLKNCPHEHVVAIIDRALECNYVEDGIQVVDYEYYKKNLKDFDIVISPFDNKEIISLLEQDGIYTYHRLEDCPPEICGYEENMWLPDLPLNIKSGNYVIYGLNLYAILLREYLKEKYNIQELYIIPEREDRQSYHYTVKYSYIINADKKIIVAHQYQIIRACNEINKTFSDKEMIEAFDFSDIIQSYRNEKLERFKNIHENERCFIVATGPSLTIKDLNLLRKHGCSCFGVNKIYLAFEETKWRPEYMVVIDDTVLATYGREILKSDIKTKFVNKDYCIEDENFCGDVYGVHISPMSFATESPCFSNNIVNKCYDGGTVVYTCIQIAVYMGYKEICLLGTDHDYSGDPQNEANHFHKDYYKGNVILNKYMGDKTELAYKVARKYADTHGIKIYNATRGGKLEVFERKSLEDILGE